MPELRGEVCLEVLSINVNQIGDSIERQTELVGLGFSQTVAALGNINASLASLLAVAKTPSQTWALEQFEMARHAFGLQLDGEALGTIDRAINGFGSQTGYGLEPRFHYLVGTIKLGGIDRLNTDCVDLPAAEAAFIRAANVTPPNKKAGENKPKAHCLAAAAHTALCQHALDRAVQHADAAIGEFGFLGDAHFIRAKVFIATGRRSDAVDALASALAADCKFALRALTDADIGTDPTVLKEATEIVKKQVQQPLTRASALVKDLLPLVDEVLSASRSDVLRPAQSGDAGLVEVLSLRAAIVSEASAVDTALSDGSLLALVKAQDDWSAARDTIAKLSNSVQSVGKRLARQIDEIVNTDRAGEEELRSQIEDARKSAASVALDILHRPIEFFLVAVPVLSILIGLIEGSFWIFIVSLITLGSMLSLPIYLFTQYRGAWAAGMIEAMIAKHRLESQDRASRCSGVQADFNSAINRLVGIFGTAQSELMAHSNIGRLSPMISIAEYARPAS